MPWPNFVKRNMQMSKVERSHDTNKLVIVAVPREGGGGGVESEGSISLKKRGFYGPYVFIEVLKVLPVFSWIN